MRPEEVDPQHALTTLLLNLRSTGQLAEIELGPLDVCDTTVLASQVAEQELDAKLSVVSTMPQKAILCSLWKPCAASFGGLGQGSKTTVLSESFPCAAAQGSGGHPVASGATFLAARDLAHLAATMAANLPSTYWRVPAN